MRIHHLLDTLAIGGAERLVVSLARLQKAAGHEVCVHTVLRTGPLAGELERAGVTVLTHRPSPKPLLLWDLYRTFRRDRPDVAHCHNILPTVYGAPAARLAGTPSIVSTRHGQSTHSPRRERKFWFSARFCACVAAVSDAARRDLLSDAWTLPEKLVTIYNGAEPATGTADGSAARSRNGFTLISVGRMTREKDFPSLLRAFALARQTIADLELCIVGDGAERPTMERMIEELGIRDRVSLPGMRQDVGAWLAKADVFVLSSVSEGLPISLLEAMAAGVPAIVTETGGMPEVVRASGGGSVVPVSQPEALAAAIVELARKRERLPEMGNSAREAYLNHFTLEQMAARYMKLYQQAGNGAARF